MGRSTDDTLAFKHRGALKLMTMSNGKTPKGEKKGYLTAILYLLPHTSGGGKTLCAHSTPACREMCLSGAGLSGLPRQIGAKQDRTDLFLDEPQGFLQALERDIQRLINLAEAEGLLPVVRLNGTSDVPWERQFLDRPGKPSLMDLFQLVRFMDYSKLPIETRRGRAPNYHLTYSYGGLQDRDRAIQYLGDGQSIAVVVPEALKLELAERRFLLNGAEVQFVDGGVNDLRFLDAPGSIVLLKPKGRIVTELVRPDIVNELGLQSTDQPFKPVSNPMARAVTPMTFPEMPTDAPAADTPEFRWVDPRELLIDETYQRDVSRRGVQLIERIVQKWDWARFKPPVVAETADGLELIDGQHTATAAASHPFIDKIPVMVVGAKQVADRASAFVGHNNERLGLSAVQIHYAKVAAQDEDALTIQQVCERAGVKLLKYPPGNGVFSPGDCIAIATIKVLVNRRHAAGARAVLQVLSDAHCAPLPSEMIKAVESVMHDAEYKDGVKAADLTSVIMSRGPELQRDARLFSAAHGVPIWRALSAILFKEANRGRRRAA